MSKFNKAKAAMLAPTTPIGKSNPFGAKPNPFKTDKGKKKVNLSGFMKAFGKK